MIQATATCLAARPRAGKATARLLMLLSPYEHAASALGATDKPTHLCVYARRAKAQMRLPIVLSTRHLIDRLQSPIDQHRKSF